MGVERVDYSSDQEFRQAQQAEEDYYQRQQFEQEQSEPDVVPCYICGCQMYEENNDPRYNVCDGCKHIINGDHKMMEDLKNTDNDVSVVEELPF
jgi:hypothetical protein